MSINFFKTVISLTTLLMLFLMAVPASSNEARTFKDWNVACTPELECTAQTSASGRTDAVTYTFLLKLRRAHGEGATMQVFLNFRKAEPGGDSPFIFEVDDGTSFRFEQGTDYVRDGDDFWLTDETQSDQLVAALRRGHTLYITFANPALRETGLAFSLAGVTASLLWMTEHQAGSSTEVVREETSGGLDIPDLVARLHKADGSCPEDNIAVGYAETHQVSENENIYILSCVSGAYNFGSRIYLFDKRYNEARILHFADYSDDYGWSGTDLLFNVFFDPDTMTLTSFSKGRGLGDCGSRAVLKWQDYQFKLLEYRYWGPCDGTRMPTHWPIIFQMK